MPASLAHLQLGPALRTEEVTEVGLLAAADPVWKDFAADDYKGYIRFKICTAFPNVIGPEAHGRYFGFHPQVLANSWQGLLHQQTNLGHVLEAYGGYKDRIMGGIVGVSFPDARGRKWEIPDDVAKAPFLDCVAVFWKLASGVKTMVGNHQTARQKTSVSIEVGTTVEDLSVYDPRDRSIMGLEQAMEAYPNLITADSQRGIQIGRVDNVQFAFAAGHADGTVPFRGVGYTPTPAEAKTAKVVELRAAYECGAACMAAMALPAWQPGDEVTWSPVFYGSDAGRGVVREVIMSGSHTRNGMTKIATPECPLLDIRVHGKSLSVLRHASSVKNSRKLD